MLLSCFNATNRKTREAAVEYARELKYLEVQVIQQACDSTKGRLTKFVWPIEEED